MLYYVSASIVVDVELEIEAVSPEEAEDMFNTKCMVTFDIVDMKKDQYYAVMEDSISEVYTVDVEEAEA